MDVKMTFLNGSLDECIYMAQPKGFTESGNDHMLCKLKRSNYILKQESRSWNICFDKLIKIFIFINLKLNHASIINEKEK